MSRDWEGDWDNNDAFDDDDDDDDDLAPLVRSSVKPLEISAPSIRRRREQQKTRKFRQTVSVLVVIIVVLFGALLHRNKNRSTTTTDVTADDSHQSNNDNNNNNDDDECDTKDDILERVESSLNFCDESTTSAGPVAVCRCNNPTEPQLRVNKTNTFMADWNATFDRNKIAAAQYAEDYDVVFFGDSITEHWQGTGLGFPIDDWQEINTVFREKFTTLGGGRLEGLALGISGDRCGQLLYRLRNGEFPEELEAKVFWILIGVNDLSLDYCSAEAVAAGNIRIVKEIQGLRPKATIVLNSILPFNPEGERDEDLSEHPKWQVASHVNHLLECFAAATDNVEFFNATKIFVDDEELHTKRSFYVDAVHPSAIGSRAWGREIEEKVVELIAGQD